MENNFNNINLDYYKIFFQVAKELSFTKASENLFISQPAVTQTINKLEQQIGEKLFLRNNKGIALTDLGEKLFKEVQNGLFYFNKIPQVIDEHKNIIEGTIKIGGGTNILREIFPDTISEFLKIYPNINFSLIDEHKCVLFDELINGNVDIVIVQNQQIDKNMFSVFPIFQDNFVFFCHKDYKIEKSKNPKTLENYEFILPITEMTTRGLVNQTFEKCGIKPKIKFEVAGQNLILSLVSKNLGVGFLPYERVKKEIDSGLFKIVPLDIDLPVSDYCAVVLKEYSSPATKAFLPYLLKEK